MAVRFSSNIGNNPHVKRNEEGPMGKWGIKWFFVITCLAKNFFIVILKCCIRCCIRSAMSCLAKKSKTSGFTLGWVLSDRKWLITSVFRKEKYCNLFSCEDTFVVVHPIVMKNKTNMEFQTVFLIANLVPHGARCSRKK